MVARRLLIVLAVLVALTALAAGVAPRKQSGGDQGASTPSAGTPAHASGNVEKTLDAGATDQRVVARVGQTVVLTVKSDELATINLAESGDHTAEPGSPARFELLADVPGTYAIDRLETEQQIGTLEIRKAG